MESVKTLQTDESAPDTLVEYFTSSDEDEQSVQKKVSIISKLPQDFEDQVKTYISECKEEYEEKSSSEEFDLKAATRGKVFEMLVKAEFAEEEDTLQARISDEIQELISDPEKYKLKEFLTLGRIPDLAHVRITEKGDVSIDYAIEAKTGLLDKRSYEQLKDSSFLNTFRSLTRVLNRLSRKSLKNCELENLAEVKKSGYFFVVSLDFRQKLVVPADRNLDYLFEMIDTKGFKAYEKDEFTRLLEKIEPKKSAFNNKDISVISGYVMERM